MTCRPICKLFSVLLSTLLAALFLSAGPALASEPPAPMPETGGVAEVWRCEHLPMPSPTGTVTPEPVVLDDGGDPPVPTETVTPPEYPLPSPTATEDRCRVTSWATLSPVPTVTVTGEPPVSTEPEAVLLAPAQFDRLDLMSESAVFLLGALVLVLVGLTVYYLSTPPRFGLKR